MSGSSLEASILSSLLPQVRELAFAAGEAILAIERSGDFDPQIKGDGSPLTRADKASHHILSQGLENLSYQFPVLSEESSDLEDSDLRLQWETYWLLDPLDGTKEFLKRNGEYTVNVALIHQGKPVLGVVLQPATSTSWFAAQGLGAWKTTSRGTEAQSLPLHSPSSDETRSKAIRVVASRSHLSDETKSFIQNLEDQGNSVEFLSCGSSIKLCLVAEGSADVYPRLAPTMEWDTAAAHAVASEAGCQVLDWNERLPLAYNKPSLLNPWFLVTAPHFQAL